jgi:hypothetical protein
MFVPVGRGYQRAPRLPKCATRVYAGYQMPRYLVSYSSADGKPTREYVEGPSILGVRDELARGGASDVRVHMEDILSREGRNVAAEGKHTATAPMVAFWKAVRQWSIGLGLGAAFEVWRWASTGTWSAFWLAVLAVGVLWAAMSVSPLPLNEACERARVWHDWERVLSLLPFLTANPLMRSPAMQYNFGSMRASALAGLGRLDEARHALDRVGPASGLSREALDVVRSSLLILAHRHDEAIVLRRRAAAANPKHGLDAAIAILRWGEDLPGARALLEERERADLTELERAFLSWGMGLLALAEGEPRAALALFDASRAVLGDNIPSPARRESLQLLMDSFRILALAGDGRVSEARPLLGAVTPFLTATDPDLLEQCEAAVG